MIRQGSRSFAYGPPRRRFFACELWPLAPNRAS